MAKLTLADALKLGVEAQKIGQVQKADGYYTSILKVKPDHPAANYNLGVLAVSIGKPQQALGLFEKALKANPSIDQHWLKYASTLVNLGKIKEATRLAQKAKKDNLHRDLIQKLNDLTASQTISGSQKSAQETEYELRVLYDQGQLEQVIAQAAIHIKRDPDAFVIWNFLGAAYKGLGKIEEAAEAFKKVTQLSPSHADGYGNLGIALRQQGKLEQAINAQRKALSLKPDFAEAYSNMGVILVEQGKLEEAIEAFKKAVTLKPDYAGAHAQMIHQKQHICDWSNRAQDSASAARLGIKTAAVPPFSMLSLEDNPERHLLRSQRYAAETFKHDPPSLPAPPIKKPAKLRIGYFSSDFREHPVTRLMAKVLKVHDRTRFDVFGYAVAGSKFDTMQTKLSETFDQFKDVHGFSNQAIKETAHNDGIDIAIDLTGYTKDSRSGLFACRLAPIQINFLGYPGSMGANFMDYIVADPFLIPESYKTYYSEKIIYMPHTYQPQDDGLVIDNSAPSRFELGLPKDGFVFCAINRSYKIDPQVFKIWMRLLKKKPNSVLWLVMSNKASKVNLIKQAQKQGVNAERLIFSEKVEHKKYLAQFQQADLFLDTHIYNAGATASNALWAGLPVLTKSGKSYTSRMAGSLLNAIGLPELITTTDEEYESLALDLAQNREKLNRIRNTLLRNLKTHPLFDTERYTRNLELGFEIAYDFHWQGKGPEHIIVTDKNSLI